MYDISRNPKTGLWHVITLLDAKWRTWLPMEQGFTRKDDAIARMKHYMQAEKAQKACLETI